MSIKLHQLSKTFDGITAVDEVSLNIDSGDFCCVVGPSGCGKSTLLRLIAGLETPDSGSVLISNKQMSTPTEFLPPEDRQIGVVFQSYALWPHMTAVENVAFPYTTRGMKKQLAVKKAYDHLDTVSLTSYANRKPESLSGGQRQRVALARSLAGEVNTVLMDEPLANLDPHLRADMEHELKLFHENSGVTTFYITHDQREAMALADQLAVMSRGRILQVGSPQAIYERPVDKDVARFIGRGAIVQARLMGKTASIGSHTFQLTFNEDEPSRTSREGLVFVRPEHVVTSCDSISRQVKSPRADSQDSLQARIDAVTYRGGYWEANTTLLETGDQLALGLDAQVRVGDVIPIQITSACLLH